MFDASTDPKDYLLAAVLGALGGGLLVALTTRAIPMMMTAIMPTMMRSMMAQMQEMGCDPSEI